MFGGAQAMVLLAAVAGATPPVDPFSTCRAQFAQNPQDYESSFCFYQVALNQRLWEDGARVFEALVKEHPENFWIPLAYGHIYRGRDADRAESLYRRSADGFRRTNNAEGEILARSSLRDVLFPRGRLPDTAREVARVVEIGNAVQDPILKAWAWTLQATHVQDTGRDLGLAFRLLKQGEDAIFPRGPYRLQRAWLISMGAVAFRLGRLDEALVNYRRLDELAAVRGEGRVRANAQYNILNTASLKESILPTAGGKQALLRLAEQALATATAAESADNAAKTHRALAELLANESGMRAAALDHAQHCVDLAVKMQLPHDHAMCSWVEASLLRETDPKRSRAAEDRAIAAAALVNRPGTHAYSAGRRMRLSWQTHARPEAILDSLAAIDAIEVLRELQEDAVGGAELFSTWTLDYYWLAGRLLQDAQEADVELAFSITERMRARALLDALSRSKAASDVPNPIADARRRVLEDIASVQRTLMNRTLAEHDRKAQIEKMEGLERQEREAARQIAASTPGRRHPTAMFADLGTIQATLAEDEALLSFQVGLWTTYDGEFGGGSWLVAATRHRRAVYRLPDRAQLAPLVPVFTGLLSRGDGLEVVPAVRLYDNLLSAAVRDLPAGIRRLILVPDGVLHHLPFDALRPARDALPLGASYQMVVAPSATLWHYWRMKKSPTATHRVLALADPELDAAVSGDASERNAMLQQGLRLGRLPYARRESSALQRHINGVDALVGSEASERAVKERDLRRYDILHLAAHAIADEAHPERSAVLLSAGAGHEDGLLQAREISDLDLDGRIVVLSACRTVSGALLSGEGVLSLARAFFAAGAHAVIGSRWPIRDEDAASFFDAFYRILGEGASLAEALTRAKGESIAAGRPASAWAGVVLLGDGSLRPFPDGQPQTGLSRWPTALLGALIVAAIAVTLFRVRRSSL